MGLTKKDTDGQSNHFTLFQVIYTNTYFCLWKKSISTEITPMRLSSLGIFNGSTASCDQLEPPPSLSAGYKSSKYTHSVSSRVLTCIIWDRHTSLSRSINFHKFHIHVHVPYCYKYCVNLNITAFVNCNVKKVLLYYLDLRPTSTISPPLLGLKSYISLHVGPCKTE